MSSSSDIEKLFDHFGGDAKAYQEIGRENEAHTARTRWPLLVTLDLRQPPIPPIGQRAEARPQPTADDTAASTARQDGAPKDAASVTRAKAPLFTRSHRRDIPPVAVAVAPPATPRGASRFSSPETKSQATAAPAPVGVDAVPPSVQAIAEQKQTAAADVAVASVAPIASIAAIAPVVSIPPGTATTPAASVPPTVSMQTASAQAARPTPAWVQAPAPARAFATPATPATLTSAPPATAKQPASASILGKLFAPQSKAAPPRAAAPATESVPLQSLFDRLRGTPHGTTAAPRNTASAANNAGHAAHNSWLVSGPRRS
ncbi:cellulose biosynthesis protein BcsP [Paraburkholderia rhynchosiae]|uniref:Cellulose biosynthesis protein BcsR n=1 Tax=Paraburkholderia rhynchosiae TaxID=487049 RepID=A0A2N7WSR1_9BURK|nr:cellulose biosynthesis protein BcsP [Paraburkholderia rhynchosiae]PMS32440.1 hypothetical protein C0Z16_07505 [Paraburkholderia rhynchosiae]CAB3675428.1 hypothetical protein LMG27174_02362 [Paraburkholderia rhynchosiae]